MEDHLWLKRFIIRRTKEFIQQIKELCGQPWAIDISAPRCELSLRVHHSYLSTFKHCQIPNLAKQSTQVLLTCLESRLWIKGGVEAYYLSRWSVETAKLVWWLLAEGWTKLREVKSTVISKTGYF